MTDPNLTSFRRSGIVSYYQQLHQLQPAEETVLQTLTEQLGHMTLLDLGVGAGRTSQHIAHRVKDYTGVDYSPEMIEVCQNRFGKCSQQIKFEVADVREMSRFPSNQYDFIWFSFNGIDNISHEDRLQFFAEVQRIGKAGSQFFFSTHNLDAMTPEFSVGHKLSWNPLSSYVNLIMWGFLRVFNPHLNPKNLKTLDYSIIRDESHNYRLRQYYIRPKAQVEQLTPFFQNISVYSWKTGKAIAPQEFDKQSDMWIYYLCTIV